MKSKLLKKKEIKEDKYWHIRSADEVITELNSRKKGLTDIEAENLTKVHGLNKLAAEKKFNGLKTLWNNINSLLIYVLFTSAMISLFLNEMVEFIVIMLIILLTITLSFIQEYKADQSIKALSKLTAKKIEVLRNGTKKTILAEHLVPGDIIYLKRGIIVPADARIIESNSLTANESILTGESVSKNKISDHIEEQDITIGDKKNMIFAGTSITTGTGIAIVVETGLNSEIGKISSSLNEIAEEKSPIQKKIDRMSKKISYIVIFVCFLLFLIMLIQGQTIFAIMVLIGAVAVSGIPESFPLALTMTFTNGIKKMAKQNAIVKDMNSVETLGTTTVICTDKTGTLTENKMRVAKLVFPNEKEITIEGKGYEPINTFKLGDKTIDIKSLKKRENFFKTAILCNDTQLTHENSFWDINGEPTEGALITLAKSAGYDEEVLKENEVRVFEVPFDSSKKYMITLNKENKTYNAYLKGAPEKILDLCSHYQTSSKLEKITSKNKKEFLDQIEEYSKEGLRILFLASKKVDSKLGAKIEKDKKESHLISDKDFVFEGFVAIEDPIREDVYGAVEECMSAGIKIKMITGDYKTTATHIGKKLGLFTSDKSKVIEGKEIDNLTDEEFDKIIDDIVIFSRTTPEHKLRIVTSLQRKGEIVAMTGDGVNDAPALKKADIGIAMGKCGTEVAKEAANMILTDDNFSTIVKAVKEGRTIYSNIRRFIYYLLAGNLTEVGIIFIAILFGLSLPLTALMILFINIVTSTIPAMALSIEPTHDKVMKQKPRNPKENLLSGYILSKILVLIPFMIFGTLGLFLWELKVMGSGLEKAMTIAFATLILFELFHTFNARRLHTSIFDKGFFSNKLVFVAFISSFLLTLLVIYTDFGNSIFKTVPLGFNDWLAILFVSSTVVIFTEIIKLSVRTEFIEQQNLHGGHFIKLE